VHGKEQKERMERRSEILALMIERERKEKKRYKELDCSIKSNCKEAKKECLSEKCKEIEAVQEKHDTFNMHKKVKQEIGKIMTRENKQ